MKYLIDTTEVYRVDTEKEVETLIEAAKKNQKQYSLVKYTSVQKNRKEKGEIVETWFKVTLTKRFNDEKDPIQTINVNYIEGSAFPVIEGDKDED